MGCYICITDVQKSIDKISGQKKSTKGHREIPIGHREIPIGQRGLKSRKISAIFFSEKGKKTLLIRLAVKRSKGQYIIYISK
jgi:hypothetical protein